MNEKLLYELLKVQQRTNAYAARIEISQLISEIRRDSKRLEPFGYKVYSQSDEDGIIEEIFKRLNINSGTFLEIGVENGLECNTLFLLHKGWRGAWIEGNENQTQAIQSKFSKIKSRLNVAIGFITRENINLAIKDVTNNHEIDFFSLDIDGNDIHILEAMNAKPKVICVEYNSKFPAHISKKPVYDPAFVWRGTDYMGASLKALTESSGLSEYRLVGTNISGTNAFFVRNDLIKNQFTNNYSVDYLYNPPRYHLIFDHFVNTGHPADFGEYEDFLD